MVIEIHSKTRTETLFPSLSLLYSAQPPPTFGNLLIDTYCGLCRTVLNRALGEQCVAPNLLLKNILHCLVTFSSYAYTPKSLKNFLFLLPLRLTKLLSLHLAFCFCTVSLCTAAVQQRANHTGRTKTVLDGPNALHTHRLSFPSRSPLPIIQFSIFLFIAPKRLPVVCKQKKSLLFDRSP